MQKPNEKPEHQNFLEQGPVGVSNLDFTKQGGLVPMNVFRVY